MAGCSKSKSGGGSSEIQVHTTPQTKIVKRTPPPQKHTTAGIRWWSPTQLLICRSESYGRQSGRDAQFSSVCGRMWKLLLWNDIYPFEAWINCNADRRSPTMIIHRILEQIKFIGQDLKSEKISIKHSKCLELSSWRVGSDIHCMP